MGKYAGTSFYGELDWDWEMQLFTQRQVAYDRSWLASGINNSECSSVWCWGFCLQPRTEAPLSELWDQAVWPWWCPTSFVSLPAAVRLGAGVVEKDTFPLFLFRTNLCELWLILVGQTPVLVLWLIGDLPVCVSFILQKRKQVMWFIQDDTWGPCFLSKTLSLPKHILEIHCGVPLAWKLPPTLH